MERGGGAMLTLFSLPLSWIDVPPDQADDAHDAAGSNRTKFESI
jgi:hypothetical protein